MGRREWFAWWLKFSKFKVKELILLDILCHLIFANILNLWSAKIYYPSSGTKLDFSTIANMHHRVSE